MFLNTVGDCPLIHPTIAQTAPTNTINNTPPYKWPPCYYSPFAILHSLPNWIHSLLCSAYTRKSGACKQHCLGKWDTSRKTERGKRDRSGLFLTWSCQLPSRILTVAAIASDHNFGQATPQFWLSREFGELFLPSRLKDGNTFQCC